MDAYTAIYRKGCTPPESVGWNNRGNNKAFLAEAIVMTPNITLSIPNALKHERPEDYYRNAATIEWPDGVDGQPLAITRLPSPLRSSRPAGPAPRPRSSCAFSSAEGWLAHYLDFAGERFLPPMPKLVDAAVLARPERPAPDGARRSRS